MNRTVITTLTFCLVTCLGHKALCQESSSPSTLFQQLQSPDNTDKAAEQLLQLGKDSMEVRKYLVTNLPHMIDRRTAAVGEDKPWENAVCLAGKLKIVEAATALAKWLALDTGSDAVTLTTVLRLEDNAPGKALAQIGDPAVPVLIKVLNNKNVKERTRAVYALNLIGTPIAKNALRDQLNRESDPGLRDIILRTLDHWKAE